VAKGSKDDAGLVLRAGNAASIQTQEVEGGTQTRIRPKSERRPIKCKGNTDRRALKGQ